MTSVAERQRILPPRRIGHVIHRTESTELSMAFFEDGEGNMFALMIEVPAQRTGR